KPTLVQKETIPFILNGQNIMAQSKTGTGKTLAFVLPIIEQLKYLNNEVFILVPTRELAKQVNDVIKGLRHPKVKSLTIYGGVSINNQIKALKQGVNIIVGTPGRIIDLYKRKHLRFNNTRFVVLDEADRLWDMGFAPDIKYILRQIKTNYQFLLFSATLDYDMRQLVKKSTGNKFKFLNLSRDSLTVGSTLQFYYLIDFYEEKFKTFVNLLKKEHPKSALIFVNTKKTASWLYNKLKGRKDIKYKIGIISGNLTQFQREKILRDYRENKIDLLIATDVAARGLDINDISHIFNYDVPKYPDVYVHRIGRTSRMGKKGVAITLCLKDEYEYLCNIEGLIDKEIHKKMLRAPEHTPRYKSPFY
ncbi:MAG: DEAD/DEAH box helicase, partial [Promethearchaeota archaeon]